MGTGCGLFCGSTVLFGEPATLQCRLLNRNYQSYFSRPRSHVCGYGKLIKLVYKSYTQLQECNIINFNNLAVLLSTNKAMLV